MTDIAPIIFREEHRDMARINSAGEVTLDWKEIEKVAASSANYCWQYAKLMIAIRDRTYGEIKK